MTNVRDILWQMVHSVTEPVQQSDHNITSFSCRTFRSGNFVQQICKTKQVLDNLLQQPTCGGKSLANDRL